MKSEELEPMHPAARKFLEVVFRYVTVEGVTRRLEFRDEPDGTTTVMLVAPERLGAPTIYLGFPECWWPPADEDWDEAFVEEIERDGVFGEKLCSCGQPGSIECQIGKCAPSTRWCAECYEEAHLPEDEQN